MKLTKEMTIIEFNQEFQKQFPLLKVEFYSKKHKHFEGSKEKALISEEMTFGSITKTEVNGHLEIDEGNSVDQFETMLETKYGLHAQVFRKSRDQWLQTSITDSWTLAKQEAKAESSERFYSSRS